MHDIPNSAKPTRDVIASQIKQDIVTGVLNLGQRIPESLYASKFQVSRTPVREAVLSLSTLGLAYVKSRSGSYVLSFSRETLADLFKARFQIEASSVRYANPTARDTLLAKLKELEETMLQSASSADGYFQFRDADTLFHRAFVEASESPWLLQSYEAIEVCALAARSRLDKSCYVTNVAFDHHKILIECLQDGDIDRFEKTLYDHLEWVHGMLKEILFS